MGNTRNTCRTVLIALGGITLAAGLAACTPGQPEPTASAPDASSASPAVTATPTPTAFIDPAETAAWAAGAVPTSGSDGFKLAQNGRFQGDAPGSFSLTASTLPAGSYSVYLACRGDADTTVTLSANNDVGTTLTSGCSDVSSGMTFSTTSDGTEFTLLSDSEAPVEWALAVTELLPGAEG
ncbi:hypothetical protein [Cryobacterium sp. PAMC25264]|uniref:hypothetical protein n=1 Tax=Cryobacterium sp. PAMC25264 TaxID=2861288 RepID=UPI001C63303C|nr:hypothetical protein [Cryobacterium sp. PAMC25264]QYF73128.1 hypothetical protein KY500_15435 [Cryobacterium sp. PAMC25264]